MDSVKAPFPWFGGKRRITPIIWSGLGQVTNYVEPFAGSLAVLLTNPHPAKIETVNDLDCGLTNFWRAVSQDPEAVAKYADHPVNEADMHARHRYLVAAITDEFRTKMHSDPDFYDVKLAGYWVYGIGASVGNNWLQPKGLKALPILSSAGGGIHGLTYSIQEQFPLLQKRLRRVRVCCGDWKRVVTPSVCHNNVALGEKDITGVFLDPPYAQASRDKVYKEEEDIFQQVCQWAINNGDNSKLRIVVCGYDGDAQFPDTWQKHTWKTGGGLANLGDGRGKTNAEREVIWFSPACLPVISH